MTHVTLAISTGTVDLITANLASGMIHITGSGVIGLIHGFTVSVNTGDVTLAG
jgi:hypothetical protein